MVSYRVLYMLVSCFVFVVFLIGFWVLENKLSYDAFDDGFFINRRLYYLNTTVFFNYRRLYNV